MSVNIDLQMHDSLHRHEDFNKRILKRDQVWVASFKISRIFQFN